MKRHSLNTSKNIDNTIVVIAKLSYFSCQSLAVLVGGELLFINVA